jgi:uncharacterized Zn finger protein
MGFNRRWAPYVSVAQRRAKAARDASKLSKKGQNLRPIQINSRAIATSFWGLAWCDNLEIYADWANRMPRGRTYARNGSIVDLQIETGKIRALVSGSSLYKIKISIEPLNKQRWQSIRSDCAQQVSSLLDLLRGKLPDAVLARLTDPKKGMFPSPKELKLQCSCPDYATMCKHIAATLYGVGHLLDSEPALFFKMRGVDQTELVSDAITTQACDDAIGLNQQSDLASEDLSAIFGIDLATTSEVRPKIHSLEHSNSKSKLPKPANKRVANPKSTGKPKRQRASQNSTSQSAILTKKAKGNVEPPMAATGSKSLSIKTSKAKKTAKPKKPVKEDSIKKASIPKINKRKPAKQAAKSRIIGTRKQPPVARNKASKKTSSKKATQ